MRCRLSHQVRYDTLEPFDVPSQYHLVDVDTGEIQPVELPVPYGWGWLTFGDSRLLTSDAAATAITL